MRYRLDFLHEGRYPLKLLTHHDIFRLAKSGMDVYNAIIGQKVTFLKILYGEEANWAKNNIFGLYFQILLKFNHFRKNFCIIP